jgi:hypothetical protein
VALSHGGDWEEGEGLGLSGFAQATIICFLSEPILIKGQDWFREKANDCCLGKPTQTQSFSLFPVATMAQGHVLVVLDEYSDSNTKLVGDRRNQ